MHSHVSRDNERGGRIRQKELMPVGPGQQFFFLTQPGQQLVPLAVQAGNRKPKRNGKVGPTRLALFRAYVSQTKLPGLQSSGLSRLVTFWAASGRTTFEAHLTDENLHARAGSGGKTTLLRTPLLSQSKARRLFRSLSALQ